MAGSASSPATHSASRNNKSSSSSKKKEEPSFWTYLLAVFKFLGQKLRPTRNSHQLVTLYAGQRLDAKSFVVHKDFTCYYYPVLKAAFRSNFIEVKLKHFVWAKQIRRQFVFW